MSADRMTLASIGAGQTAEEAVHLWVATPGGRTRLVALTDKQALALVRQVAQILEKRV